MRIEVNGIRIFFDVEGAKFVPDGPIMREKPTLILLHGGPGADHSGFKPAFSQYADIAQVIYIDHRGNGRSDREPREAWNLAQWGDDVYEFCRALEIERPIVFGGSFGGFVAISYASTLSIRASSSSRARMQPGARTRTERSNCLRALAAKNLATSQEPISGTERPRRTWANGSRRRRRTTTGDRKAILIRANVR